MEDFDSAIAVAVALAVEDETDVPKRKRAKWSKEWFLQRSTFGHTKLLRELSHNEPGDLKNFLRMDAESYNELLQMVEPLIEKQTTNMRQPISPTERLSITLRYLATGNTFEDLKFVSAIAPQTIGKIVTETCEAIISCLHEYIKAMFLCDICGTGFSLRHNLRRHSRTIHGYVEQNDGKTRSFDSWEEFLQWKNEQEASTNDRFNITSSSSKGYYYYKCYLSGNRRKPTEGGTGGAGCRASISAYKPKDGGPVIATFLFEHNHDRSEKVRLSALDRSFIKERAKMGMSHDRILADARATTANGTPLRLHILTKQDIRNVLHSTRKLPASDISSIDLESGQDVGGTLTQLFHSMADRVPKLSRDQRVRALCSLNELKSSIFDKTL